MRAFNERVDETWGRDVGRYTYQRAGGVDTCVADGGVIEPFRLGEPKEPVAGDVHGSVGGRV